MKAEGAKEAARGGRGRRGARRTRETRRAADARNAARGYSNSKLFSASPFVLRSGYQGIVCGSDLQSLTELRLDFEIHSESFENSPAKDNGHYF